MERAGNLHGDSFEYMAQRYIYTLKGHDDNEATRNIRAASPTMEAGKMKEGGTRQI